MGTLRKQMHGDLVIRGMAERTRKAYLGAVVGLTKYYAASSRSLCRRD